jgi:hypothetical protein
VGIYALNPGMMSTDFLTHLQAVSGYEKGLNALQTVIRMWATPPEVPAQRVIWLASSATDGKHRRLRAGSAGSSACWL